MEERQRPRAAAFRGLGVRGSSASGSATAQVVIVSGMAEIGLFPLGIVLLPTEQVPLHIFDDRYKELIGECLAEEREFGLVYADDDGLRQSERSRR